jgi:hypothetical protein
MLSARVADLLDSLSSVVVLWLCCAAAVLCCVGVDQLPQQQEVVGSCESIRPSLQHGIGKRDRNVDRDAEGGQGEEESSTHQQGSIHQQDVPTRGFGHPCAQEPRLSSLPAQQCIRSLSHHLLVAVFFRPLLFQAPFSTCSKTFSITFKQSSQWMDKTKNK